MEENTKAPEEKAGFLFIAGRRCLDFVNTELIKAGQRADLITDGETLRGWLAAAGLLNVNESTLGEQAEAVEAAIALRAAVRSIATALSQEEAVPQASLDTLNAVLARNRGTWQIAQDEATGAYTKRFVSEGNGPDRLLLPIARDAADLLCHGEHAFVRQCENPQCILFFYDTTKNHKRRWCRMTACGNRAKAAAHYRRKQRQSL